MYLFILYLFMAIQHILKIMKGNTESPCTDIFFEVQTNHTTVQGFHQSKYPCLLQKRSMSFNF
jgi:hypothetical protein